jgi:hypothetical protein
LLENEHACQWRFRLYSSKRMPELEITLSTLMVDEEPARDGNDGIL